MKRYDDAPLPPARLLLGPGPSMVHPRVLHAMSVPLIGHLDPAFLTIMDEMQQQVAFAFRNANPLTIPISGTGSAGMEAALVNVIEPAMRSSSESTVSSVRAWPPWWNDAEAGLSESNLPGASIIEPERDCRRIEAVCAGQSRGGRARRNLYGSPSTVWRTSAALCRTFRYALDRRCRDLARPAFLRRRRLEHRYRL